MDRQALMQAMMGSGGQGGAPMQPPMPQQPQQGGQPSPEMVEQAIMILTQAGMLGPQGSMPPQ